MLIRQNHPLRKMLLFISLQNFYSRGILQLTKHEDVCKLYTHCHTLFLLFTMMMMAELNSTSPPPPPPAHRLLGERHIEETKRSSEGGED